MRYLLLAGATFIVGYIVGVLFGYRSAVVDYVENDAQTITAMADSMYDEVEESEIPDSLKSAIAKADSEESEANGERGFQ